MMDREARVSYTREILEEIEAALSRERYSRVSDLLALPKDAEEIEFRGIDIPFSS